MYVTTSNTEINAKNIREWITAFENDIKPIYEKLENYYLGQDDLNKVETDLDKANRRQANIIHANLSRMIVNNACGYFMGKPVTYAFNDAKFENEVRKLLWECDEQAENMSLAKDASKYGVAYELMGVEEDKSLYIQNLSPLNTFYVIDDSIRKRKVCAVTYWTRQTANKRIVTKGYAYSKDEIIPFHGEGNLEFDAPEVNPFKPIIPVFEFKNNDECLGDYASVLELLSAYSKLISSNFDDIDSLANAILALVNARLNPDEAKELKKSRVLELMGDNTDIKYINKQLDTEFAKHLRSALRDDIFAITNIPDLTDEKFAGNQSGVAISYKLIGFENLRLIKKNYFEKGLYERLTCLKNYMKFGNSAEQIPEGEIVITFQTNLPSNIDKDKQIADLYNAGVLSLETALELIESVDDVKEELKRIESERPDMEEPTDEQSNEEE